MAVRGQLVAVNSSIIWILEVKLRSSDLVAGSSVTEPTKVAPALLFCYKMWPAVIIFQLWSYFGFMT